ncbi:MAG: DNA polymerase III subunit gamma/tau, partial [Candidatus Infernicultor aquiphilus]
MAYQSLYRKWRPQVFEDIIGQKHITQTLINAISLNRISHAYLFSGPRGVGKTTTARILAK